MLRNRGPAWALAVLCAVAAYGLLTRASFIAPPEKRAPPHSYEKPQHKGPGVTAERKSDDKIADYTWWLTFFTAVLGGASIFQAYFLIRTDKTARTSADAAKLAADAAVEQSKLAGLQLDLVEKQHGVARAQFFAANRPRLIVHFIRRVFDHSDLPEDEQPFAAEFRIMNVGTSRRMGYRKPDSARSIYSRSMALSRRIGRRGSH